MQPRGPREHSHGTRWLRSSALLLLGLASGSWPQNTEGQVLTKVGSFAAKTVTGGQPCPNNPNCTQAVTGVTFQPKAVIFFWTAQAATGFANNASAGYGFATATEGRAVTFASNTNLSFASHLPARWQWGNATTNRCIGVVTDVTQTAADAEAWLESMDADGFTIHWQTKPSSNWIIHYMALGGADITNAKIGDFTPSANADPHVAQSQSFTGVGFQPDFLMFLSVDSNTVGSKVTPDGRVSTGFAGKSKAYGITQGGNTAASKAGGSSIITSSAQLATAAILEKGPDSNEGSVDFVAAVTSFDADGFTLNKVHNHDQTVVHYLALKGGQYRVGEIPRPTVAGAQTLPYVGGFHPQGPPLLVHESRQWQLGRRGTALLQRRGRGDPLQPARDLLPRQDKQPCR